MLVRLHFHENRINLTEHEEKAHVFVQDSLQASRFAAQSLMVPAAFGWTYQAFEHSLAQLENYHVAPCKGFGNHFASKWFATIQRIALVKPLPPQYWDPKRPMSTAASWGASACCLVLPVTSSSFWVIYLTGRNFLLIRPFDSEEVATSDRLPWPLCLFCFGQHDLCGWQAKLPSLLDSSLCLEVNGLVDLDRRGHERLVTETSSAASLSDSLQVTWEKLFIFINDEIKFVGFFIIIQNLSEYQFNWCYYFILYIKGIFTRIYLTFAC